jgi:ABC-type transport system involved in multi-copper enzyme maturation permease subunit
MAGARTASAGSGLELAVMVGTYGFCHVMIAVFCLSIAVAVVRNTALGQLEGAPLRPPPLERPVLVLARPKSGAKERMSVPRHSPHRRTHGPNRDSVPIGAHPLLWKEVYHGSRGVGADFGVLVLTLGAVLIPLLILVFLGFTATSDSTISYYEFARNQLNPIIRGECMCLAGLWAASVAFLAGRSITQEREMQTLDGLLTLPVEREGILGAKWLGSILRGRYLGYALGAYLVLGLFSGAIHPLGVLLMAVAFAIHITFLASLGVCLSLISRNTLWANFTMALMLLLVFVGSWVVLMYSAVLTGARGMPTQNWWNTFSEFGLNPPRTWWHLGFTWDEFHGEILHGPGLFRGSYGACLAGLLFFGLATVIFWLAARVRFRQEQTGTR